MYGGGFNNFGGGGFGERATDNFIQNNVPGGLNSKWNSWRKESTVDHV